MHLTTVLFVFENAPSWRQSMGIWSHVVHAVGGFLVDFHAIQLHEAVQRNDINLVRFLVGPGEDSFGKGVDLYQVKRAIQVAVANNCSEEFCEVLLTCTACGGRDLMLQGMKSAARHGNKRLFDWFCSKAACNWFPMEVLGEAAASGQHAIVKYMVEAKHLVVGYQDASGAALQAIACQQEEIAKYLVQHCTINCFLCLIEAAVSKGSLTLAAWLEAFGNQWHRTEQPCNVQHAKTTELLENKFVVEPLVLHRPHTELTWLQQHFPDVWSHWHNQLLVLAARSGDMAKVELVYKSFPADPEQPTIEAAINAACSGGHLSVATFFVRNGHAIESLDEAVKSGAMPLVQFLCEECGVSRFDDLEGAIDAAACAGHVEVVQRFDTSRTTAYPVASFCNASRDGNLEMLRFLLSRPHDSDVLVKALLDGFRGAQVQAVKLIYGEMQRNEQFERMKEMMWTSLVHLRELHTARDAKRFGTWEHMEVLRFLLVHEETLTAQLNFRGVIQLAIRMRQLGVIQLLLDKQAQGFDGLLMNDAVRCGSLSVVRFLHEHVRVSCGANAMDIAASKGFLHIVEFLHRHRSEGCTGNAMVDAASRGHWRVVKFLREERCEGDLKRAFWQAIEHGQLEVVKYLFGVAGEELDVEEALCRACDFVRVGIVRWFVESCGSVGADAFEGVLRWIHTKQYVQCYHQMDRVERESIVGVLEQGLTLRQARECYVRNRLVSVA